MPCLDPHEIAELAFARLHGENPAPPLAQRLDHVLHCAQCRQLLNHNVELLEQLKTALNQEPAANTPADCLDDNTLSEFLDNTLDAQARQRAEAHLAQCHECLRQLLDLYDIRSETTPADVDEPDHPFQVVIGLLADGLLRLLNSPAEGFTLLQNEPVPVLGTPKKPGQQHDAPAIRWIQLAGGMKINVTSVHRSPGAMDVQIQLEPPLSHAQLTVRRENSIIFSEPFSTAGLARVSRLRAGTYHCAIEEGVELRAVFLLQIVEMSMS